MRKVIRYIAAKTYQPLVVKYLSHTRTYSYKNITLQVPPEVFHPGFFYSTKLLLNFIENMPLQQRTFLELGAGSGLISVFAAKKQAAVTATDINPVAIEYLFRNKAANKVNITVLHSDMFSAIPLQSFDIIAINPPYYKKDPDSHKSYAWYCGKKGEYFQELFKNLGQYMHTGSNVVMTLCDGCDIEMIRTIALQNHFSITCALKKKNLVEDHFIYKIDRMYEN